MYIDDLDRKSACHEYLKDAGSSSQSGQTSDQDTSQLPVLRKDAAASSTYCWIYDALLHGEWACELSALPSEYRDLIPEATAHINTAFARQPLKFWFPRSTWMQQFQHT